MISNANMSQLNRRRVVFITCALLPISFVTALAFGTINISIVDTLSSLLSVFSNSDEAQSRVDLVIQQIRLPRALLAAIVGALLGMCGATTQGLFRNPLADPSLIGVTAGASAGAALAIFFVGSTGLSIGSFLGVSMGLGLVSIGSFIGGAIAVLVVYTLASNTRGTSVATMLLAGIAITALASSLTNILEFFGDEETLRRISLWRMGGLDGASYSRVFLAAIIGAIVMLILPRYSTALNALLLGESEARHLGLSVQSIKVSLILLVAAGVGASVALAGTIAFIGLIVPHIIRLLIGPDHRYLLPVSALGGACLLLISDTIARTIVSPIELPVGIVTAILGAPFFISLLRRRHEFGMR